MGTLGWTGQQLGIYRSIHHEYVISIQISYCRAASQPNICFAKMNSFLFCTLFLAVAVYSQPIYDETKEIHCGSLFPNTLSTMHSKLNETLVHLEGAYFALLDPIDMYLQSVVYAEGTACLSIMKLIKDYSASLTTPAPVST